MPLIDSVVDSVSNTNFKTVGESVAYYTAISMGNAVAHQQRLNAISEAALGATIKNLTEVDITEAISVKQATTGNALAEVTIALGSVVAALQQLVKTSQTTPPETGKTS